MDIYYLCGGFCGAGMGNVVKFKGDRGVIDAPFYWDGSCWAFTSLCLAGGGKLKPIISNIFFHNLR